VVSVMVREEWVVNRAMIPIVWVPLWEDAVRVVAVNVWSHTVATPVSHS
jgi:hypothetical protein